MTTTVTTNGHARPLVPVWFDPTANDWKEPTTHEEYAQAENDGGSGFYYRGELYSLSEFESISRGISVPVAAPTAEERDHLAEWNGVQAQSAFSAVVVRYTDDYESVVVGYMTW